MINGCQKNNKLLRSE